ncbi:unnamed protein product [Amoebophrya sp. A25]|nr:unnamed protein product [Amoebophrya sp. A25]|eukprot:GSA25T00005104001.1
MSSNVSPLSQTNVAGPPLLEEKEKQNYSGFENRHRGKSSSFEQQQGVSLQTTVLEQHHRKLGDSDVWSF